MSRRTWLVAALLLVLVAAGLGGVAWWRAARTDTGGLRPGAYAVTLRGTAADGTAFEARGSLSVRSPGDGLPYQWCLKVGLPAGNPTPGAIWFGSHGSCFGVGKPSAVVTWQQSGGDNVLVPVNPAPSVRDSLNSFYATTVNMAEAVQPDGGEVRFHADGDTLTGAIDLRGAAMGNAKRGGYVASLAATLVSPNPAASVAP